MPGGQPPDVCVHSESTAGRHSYSCERGPVNRLDSIGGRRTASRLPGVRPPQIPYSARALSAEARQCRRTAHCAQTAHSGVDLLHRLVRSLSDREEKVWADAGAGGPPAPRRSGRSERGAGRSHGAQSSRRVGRRRLAESGAEESFSFPDPSRVGAARSPRRRSLSTKGPNAAEHPDRPGCPYAGMLSELRRHMSRCSASSARGSGLSLVASLPARSRCPQRSQRTKPSEPSGPEQTED